MSSNEVVRWKALGASSALLLGCAQTVVAQAPPPPAAVLFEDVRVFDGRSAELSGPLNVLVRGNAIERISAEPIPTDGSTPTRIIAGAGRTLMPGLIDAHAHIGQTSLSVATALTADVGYLHVVAARDAEQMLLRGFTTIRDVGSPCFGLKRAIDEGVVPGPRIYPSGAVLSQTAGHGDFRMPYEVPRRPDSPPSRGEVIGATVIADGEADVLRAAREQLLLGATQLKLMAGGGVSSMYDAIDVIQYTEAELHAAVQAAADWGTYVTVHAYTAESMQRAIRAGVRCIEHGQLADDETARSMAEQGVWWCQQPFLSDEDAIPQPDPARQAKAEMVSSGTDTAYALAKKHGVKTAFGTDTLFDAKLAARQGAVLAKLTRWYTPAEVLRMATSTNAELLALCGERNPYPGRLGVVEEGALADLLLVDGNLLEDIRLIADPAQSFAVIMKDGKLVKDLLSGGE